MNKIIFSFLIIILMSGCSKPETQVQKYERYFQECQDLSRAALRNYGHSEDSVEWLTELGRQDCSNEAYERAKSAPR